MTPSPQTLPPTESVWTRDQLVDILTTALSLSENKFARQMAVMWLATYPGDLQVRLIQARSLLQEGKQSLREQSLPILEELCASDPEYLDAQKYLAKAQHLFNNDRLETTSNCVLALGGARIRVAHGSSKQAEWAVQLRETRRLLQNQPHSKSPMQSKNLERAETLIHQVLVANPGTPLTCVTHLRVLMALGTFPDQVINQVAKAYLEQWPKCLPVMLIFAQTAMGSADYAEAVSLLHRAATRDITGQVPRRLWGETHPYRSLWPDNITISPGHANSPQNIAFPASLASAFGWNRLPSGDKQHPDQVLEMMTEHQPEPQPAQAQPDSQTHPLRHRMKAISNTHRDGRFPVYVVFSTRTGLKQQYGANGAKIIEEALHKLVVAVRGRQFGHQKWGAVLCLADDIDTTSSLGIKAARHNDPWSLKLAINDLDAALARRGERIGALLIVGGHEVVPFHHLPNPVEDIDQDVPSDNPYATRDENYYVLEWPVGRLPGGAETDCGSLVSLINGITEQHQKSARSEPWYRTWIRSLLKIISRKQKRLSDNIGYSAAVWRRASLAVYRAIGDPRSLLVSPPHQACELDHACSSNLTAHQQPIESSQYTPTCIVLPAAQFGYFNLHGLSDACEWYGQRDPTDPSQGPDFPIALRPQDIRNSGQAPRVVFSEACYGAYIHGKTAEEAIAIKFLTSGTHAVVGSTSTCYGSISSPLIAADLLGRVFWGLVSEGHLAGEALRRAKLYLAKEMHQRQGFLDGEDQKTLISFVLYGDPLAQPYSVTNQHKLIKAAPDIPAQLLTLSDQQSNALMDASPSTELVANIRQVVKQYLPGMADAQVSLSVSGGLRLADTQALVNNHSLGKSTRDSHGRQVVILSKRIEQANLVHPQLARLTLDNSGKLVKFVVSR